MKEDRCDPELRLGVIGAGGRGSLADNAHKPDEGVRLAAGCDTHPPFLDAFKEKYKPDFVTDDYRKLLDRDDIDAVFICTPDFLHEEHAVAALNAGKSVYLEKPMAITKPFVCRFSLPDTLDEIRLPADPRARHLILLFPPVPFYC